MSWRVILTDRTQVMGLKPLSVSWGAIGGPQQALLSLQNDAIGFKELQSLLGSGLEIYDPSDRLAWWGYVDQVSQPVGMTRLDSSLESLANRLAVRYRSLEPGKDFGALAQTEWKDDAISQAIYGVKEVLLERGVLSEEQALLLRDASLKRMAQPVSKLLPSTKATNSQLYCRGWFGRMRWRQWPVHTDILGHAPSQQGYQAFGASLTQQSLAQSFTLTDAVKVASLSVRIRRIGDPQAGERLWLVVKRDGVVSSTAYFSLGLDESLGFPGGKLLLLDASLGQWKPRLPDADLLFKLTALSDSVELMAQVVQTSGCFNDFSYEAGAGLSLPYVSEGGMDCQQAFLHLLRLGTADLSSLQMEVNAKRRLRVYPQPASVSPDFWLGQDGRIKNQVGKDHESAWQAVGKWLSSETGTACFLENLRLDLSDGSYHLRTNNVK
jgi:hypothetical protein